MVREIRVSGAVFRGSPRPTLRVVDTDLELLTRLRNGDEDAFVMLVSRYQQPMLRLARSYVPSRAVAEEAVQDAWMGVVRGIERFEGRSSLKTWLFRILVNRTRSAGAREIPSVPIEDAHAVEETVAHGGGVLSAIRFQARAPQRGARVGMTINSRVARPSPCPPRARRSPD